MLSIDALRQPLPDAVAMRGVAHRRVDLGQRAEPLVAVGRGEREVERRRLDGGDVLVLGEERDLLLGGDVQHVDALAGLAREPISRCVHISAASASRQTGCELRIALDPQVHALAQPVLVLGMERGAAADRLEHVAHAVVVLDQQRAGRRAHEHLDAAGAGQPLELGELVGVLARARRHRTRSRNACGDAPRATLSASAAALVVGGSVLGISNTAVTPPSTAPREPVSRSSLWVRPGSRKCTWLSITPGRTCRPRQSITSAGGRARQSPIAAIRPPRDAEIAHALAVLVDDRAALEDQVVAARHRCSTNSSLAPLSGQHQRLTFRARQQGIA